MATPLFAYDFYASNSRGDTLYYNITTDSTVEVTYDVKVYHPARLNFKGHIVIPSIVSYGGKNYHVTKIGDMAFNYCTLIDTVTIPEGVDSIGAWAFRGCYRLKSVALPVSLVNVGEGAFGSCRSLERIHFPSQNCNIGNSVFSGCSQLREVVLPSQSSKLGEMCFYNDSNLLSITMPGYMESIQRSCFEYCISLKSIVIPAGVRLIRLSAFSHCESLAECSFTTPSTLDSIEGTAFSNDSSLVRIDLSQTKLRVLERAMFNGCVSLEEVKLPNTLKLISYYVFEHNKLPYIVIPESVEYISARDKCWLNFDSWSPLFPTKYIFKSTTPAHLFNTNPNDIIYKVDTIKHGFNTIDTFFVPCGYGDVYRNAEDENWWIIKNIKEVSFAEEEIVLDSVCGPEVQERYGFYPDHSGTYCQRFPSGYACDSMAIFRITLATLPTLDDSSINVEPNKEDTSVLWTWEGTGYAYNVYRDGDYITTVEQPSYLDTNIEYNVQYCYNFAPVNEKYCEGKWSTTNCYTMLNVGVQEAEESVYWVLRPNPVKETLFVTAAGAASTDGSATHFDGNPYEITDITGRIVLQGQYNATEGIWVGGLAKGIYLLRMEGKVGKFVKE